MSKQKNKAIEVKDGKLEVGDKVIKAIMNIIVAALIAVSSGFITYHVSNEILGINKENLSRSDFTHRLRVGADNEAIRINYIKSQSMDNAKVATVVTFFVALGVMFIRVKKTDND